MDDWTTFVSPVYSVYDHWWQDPSNGKVSRVRWRLYIFFAPIDAERTAIFSFQCQDISFDCVLAIKGLVGVFPIELPTWFMKLFTKEGDIILDPFMGSGSSAVAALLSRRNFLGTELEAGYVKEANANIKEVETEVLKTKKKSQRTKAHSCKLLSTTQT